MSQVYGARKKRITVIREAAEWRLRIQDASLDECQRRKFQAWLRVPCNLAEMGRMALVDVLLERVLAEMSGPSPQSAAMRSKSQWASHRIRFGLKFRLH